MVNKNRNLNILMNNILIGVLEKTKKGELIFTYDHNWISKSGSRPLSLSMPLINKPFTGDIVYNYFDNLLPDNQQMKSRIQAKLKISTSHPFDLLAKIGKDCVGAIQIIADDDTQPDNQNKIRAQALSDEEIENVLNNYQQYPLGMTNDDDDFRISIAGAQEKSAFLYYKNKWHRPLGNTPTTHIFKLPIGIINNQQIDLSNSCENEWLCSQIAAAFGLPVAQCEILQFNTVKILSVKRFDRKFSTSNINILRIPQEDLCQALGYSPNLKYQADGGPGIKEIMRLMLNSQFMEKDQDNFFKSQILFWLLAAIDGHAKNFSIFILPDSKFHLTPLYDIMSAYPLMTNNQLHPKKIKMAMALKGKNNHYHWDHAQHRYFLETARHSHYSPFRANMILNEMLDQVDLVIDTVSAKIPDTFPQEIAVAIFNGMKMFRDMLRINATLL